MAKHQLNFSTQSNTVCGTNGVLRLSVVFKHVGTGGNFGLTNLIMVLWHAKQKGRLAPNVKRMYRHTDGGADNLNHTSHVLHWLLVYIGVFDEIVWFRFEAG